MATDKQDTRRPNPDRQISLNIQQPDPKRAADDLARRIDEIRKSIASVEDAKVVTQQLLRKEVSI